MTVEQLDESLEALVTVRPFKPFTVVLNTGKRYKIKNPGATAWRDGSGVFWSASGKLVIFDHTMVDRIIKAPTKRRSK